jgi:uncharacterized membrane protein
MQQLLAIIGWPDLVAPGFFLLAWAGYTVFADGRLGRRSLMSRMHEHRRLWLRRMLSRENRIPDLQVLLVLTQSNAFFASSAILIVGGCLAILGAREQAMEILAEIPFVAKAPLVVWELKVLLLVVVFVYAFFKFTWSLRQFNYVAILIGAAPPPEAAGTASALAYAESAAAVASRAAEHFNKAMRTFYFGLAALSWFLQPFLFVALTAVVVLVAYRREFRSHTLTAIGHAGEPIPGEVPHPVTPRA